MDNHNHKQHPRRSHNTTLRTSPSQAPHESQWPEWIRLPKTGHRCPVSILSRATLNELILGPGAPVRSAVVRKRGNTRGIRLILTESLMEYIRCNVDLKATEHGGSGK